MSFSEKYSEIKSLVKNEISIIEEKMIENVNVREPLNSVIKGFLMSPSKRVRPLLAILYAKANNEELSEEQYNFLSVIELVHNASLIHDDIIDECSTRRGKKTISAQFDNKLGVISGDYLLSIAMDKLTQIGDIGVIKKISQTIKYMCLGEINQNFDRFKIGTLDDYLEKNKNKTAYLFETALLGCMKLSHKNYDEKQLSKLALDIGVAFQIRDDILNMTNFDSSKPVNNDFAQGIYNAPVILGTKEDNYASGIEKTKVLLNNYVQSALEGIKDLPDNEYKFALVNFLELLKDV